MTLKEYLESENFYSLMQNYRMSPRDRAGEWFEKVKAGILNAAENEPLEPETEALIIKANEVIASAERTIAAGSQG